MAYLTPDAVLKISGPALAGLAENGAVKDRIPIVAAAVVPIFWMKLRRLSVLTLLSNLGVGVEKAETPPDRQRKIVTKESLRWFILLLLLMIFVRTSTVLLEILAVAMNIFYGLRVVVCYFQFVRFDVNFLSVWMMLYFDCRGCRFE